MPLWRQNYEIGIEVKGQFGKEVMEEMIERFHQEHNRSYGCFNRSMKLQMVNYRVSVIGDIIKAGFGGNAGGSECGASKAFHHTRSTV